MGAVRKMNVPTIKVEAIEKAVLAVRELQADENLLMEPKIHHKLSDLWLALQEGGIRIEAAQVQVKAKNNLKGGV